MIFDWFTIVAQVLNFLILVWLMKRFLYKPIINAIDEREKLIAAELASADRQKVDAREERGALKRKNEEFDGQRAALLSKAIEEVRAERLRLLDEARNAAAVLSLKRRETLRNEEHNLHRAIGLRTRQEVFAIARKAMTDLAGTSLEERMVDVFVRRLHELDGEEKRLLTSALEAAPGPVIVRTSFDLQQVQCSATEGAIKEILGTESNVRFETSPDLISGIELAVNGHKVAWSIAEYLTSLEKGVVELLKEQEKTEAGADLKPEEPTPKQRADNHGT